MSLYNCDPDLGEFLYDPCITLNGRVRFAFILDDVARAAFASGGGSDPTVLLDWTALINSGNIIPQGATTGEYPEPSATESEGVGHVKSTLNAFQHAVNYMHKGRVYLNRDFYNSLNKSSNHSLAFIIGRPGTEVIYFSDGPVTFRATPPVEAGEDSIVWWKIKATWDSPDIPEMALMPTGLDTL